MSTLLHRLLRDRVLMLDGAMGTMIQRHKLDEAGYRGERFKDHARDLKGNNDLLVLTQPKIIAAIHDAYLEAGAGWVPFMMHIIKRLLRQKWRFSSDQDMFREYRIFVACEADEDLPYLTQHIGEDHLLTGSDYGHNDPAEQTHLVATMKAREEIPPGLVQKILCENPRKFYGI